MGNLDFNLTDLDSLSPQEREYALQILGELNTNGESKSYDDLRYADYDEIPVDIDTFLHDKNYLGNGLINAEGKFTVFPYWVETLKKIFPNNTDTAYNTLVLTGGIGLGKSFMAVLCISYLLHRMLCLKDPYLHYGLQPIDKITFSFINVTIDAAKGVAWDKIQQLFQSSPWFMSHGTVSGRTDIVWTPSKRIELVMGSSNNVVIGRALFCLDGDTVIKTEIGDKKLSEISGRDIRVCSVDDNGKEVLSDICRVEPTVVANEEYHIEMEDGSVIKCTPNHRFMLKDGSYKEAQYLTEDDELADFSNKETYNSFLSNIIESRGQWCPTLREDYCERHHIVPKCMGGEPKTLSWERHPNVVWLTAKEHFIAHKLLAVENPTDDRLVSAFKRMCYTKRAPYEKIVTPQDYELVRRLFSVSHSLATRGKKWSSESRARAAENYSLEKKKMLSKRFSGSGNNMYGNGYKIAGERNGCYGKPVEPERLMKIKRSRSKYVYIYNGESFYGWCDLAKYLRELGYSISQGGIESCVIGKESIKDKYPALWKAIIKVPKEEYDENKIYN